MIEQVTKMYRQDLETLPIENFPWVLSEEEAAIAEDCFSEYAWEAGLHYDHTENDMDFAQEQWVFEANAKKLLMMAEVACGVLRKRLGVSKP